MDGLQELHPVRAATCYTAFTLCARPAAAGLLRCIGQKEGRLTVSTLLQWQWGGLSSFSSIALESPWSHRCLTHIPCRQRRVGELPRPAAMARCSNCGGSHHRGARGAGARSPARTGASGALHGSAQRRLPPLSRAVGDLSSVRCFRRLADCPPPLVDTVSELGL